MRTVLISVHTQGFQAPFNISDYQWEIKEVVTGLANLPLCMRSGRLCSSLLEQQVAFIWKSMLFCTHKSAFPAQLLFKQSRGRTGSFSSPSQTWGNYHQTLIFPIMRRELHIFVKITLISSDEMVQEVEISVMNHSASGERKASS